MKHARPVIRKVQVTEKSTALSTDKRQYFFEVDPEANKLAIKRAVEELYNVKVAGVNTMRYAGKARRVRTAQYGHRPDWKRAVVTLQPGQEIDLTT